MSSNGGDGKKKDPVYFYFDFSSPYAYFSALRINEIAKLYGRKVVWKPILLGVIFKETHSRPLFDQGPKGAYSTLDLDRQARMQEVPFTMPEPFPFMSTPHARAYYWIADQDEKKAKQFGRSVFKKIYGKGKPVYKPAQVVEVAEAKGVDAKALAEALTTDPVKDRLRQEVEDAVAKGVCGSPYFIVDGEPFWGNDRLDHVERWLSTGGW